MCDDELACTDVMSDHNKQVHSGLCGGNNCDDSSLNELSLAQSPVQSYGSWVHAMGWHGDPSLLCI